MENKTQLSPVNSLESETKDNNFQTNNKIKSSKKSIKGIGLVHSLESENHNPLLQQAREAELDLTKDIQKPPVVLSIDDSPLFFLGDFSLTIGKAKSRKTTLNSLFMAVLVGNISNEILQSDLPSDKLNVLLFDTEQGVYHAHKAAKRVHRMLNVENTPNFKAYSLRRYSTKERIQIIEHVISTTPDVGVVFIDGIRDLVTSINDEEQATKIVSKLMRWSQELNIHINCTLHMNKGDNNARGHLGTELLNKSLVTISVSKCGLEGRFSKVQVIESREKEPGPFMFGIDNTGLPFIVPGSDVPNMRSDMRKSIAPDQFENEEHREQLRHIFSQLAELSYGQLVNAIKAEYNIGTNKAKAIVRHFSSEDFITGEKHGNSTIYRIGSV